MIRIPDGSIKCSTCVRPENADVSIFNIGLFDNKINFTFDVPANAFVSTRKILLWLNKMVVIFCRPANANWATVANGVCWIEISRIFGRPRNANGFIVVILFPSSDNFLKLRRPANASLLIIGKLFFVSDKFSTLGGSRFVGISRNPPVLHRTCNNNKNSKYILYFSFQTFHSLMFLSILLKAKSSVFTYLRTDECTLDEFLFNYFKGTLMNTKYTFDGDVYTHLCLW